MSKVLTEIRYETGQRQRDTIEHFHFENDIDPEFVPLHLTSNAEPKMRRAMIYDMLDKQSVKVVVSVTNSGLSDSSLTA